MSSSSSAERTEPPFDKKEGEEEDKDNAGKLEAENKEEEAPAADSTDSKGNVDGVFLDLPS